MSDQPAVESAADTGVQRQCDIAIVGGGMAGAALACALAGSRWRVAVVESQPPVQFSGQDDFDPRVVALGHAVRRFLEQLGVWQSIAARRLSPFERMLVWDAEGTAEVSFDCHEAGQPALGYIVENSLLVDVLQHQLMTADNIEWICPASVAGIQPLNAVAGRKPDSATRTLQLSDGSTLQARLVVAADGALSAMRQLSGIDTVEWDYGHTAVIATVRTEKPHGRVARQRFLASGPLAFLPLHDNRSETTVCRGDGSDEYWSSIVWSTAPEQAAELLALSPEAFAVQLARAFEHRLGDVLAVQGRYGFPLRQRHARVYHRDQIVLIGDAAHTIHPLAGQGVNLGLMDVQALAEELLRAAERGLSPADPSVLARYQRRRFGSNVTMSATMELFRRLFARRELPLRWLRNTGMKGVDSLPLLKRQIMRHAMGL